MFHENLQSLLSALGEQRISKKVVFTNGCFDILHIGHVNYLKEAKDCGDLLVVGINTDASIKKLKGPDRPIQSESDRAQILAALASVDHTILFDEPTPIRLIEAIKPEVLVKGGDWPIEKIVGADFVVKHGGEVRSLQFVQGRSTSDVIARILKG